MKRTALIRGALALVTTGIILAITAWVAPLWLGWKSPLAWLVCYNAAIKAGDIAGADWAIVDQSVSPSNLRPANAKLIAYVSVGEAEGYRSYWDFVRNTDVIVEANPDWPDNHPVDIRSERWRTVLFDMTFPVLKAAGFDGVFLDTVDAPLELERRDPVRFAGSRRALVEIVGKVRADYPNWIVIANNGFTALDELGEFLDAVAVEDVHTHYDFVTKTSRRTNPAVMADKEKILDAFKKRRDKPVLNILYAPGPDSELARFAIARSREKGYSWYLTTPDLMGVGVMNDEE